MWEKHDVDCPTCACIFINVHLIFNFPAERRIFRRMPHFPQNAAFSAEHRTIIAENGPKSPQNSPHNQGFLAAESRIFGRRIKDFWPHFSGGTGKRI